MDDKASIRSWRKGSGGDDVGLSQGTLNPLPMIGGLTAGHRTDLEKLVFLCQDRRHGSLWDRAVDIGNENDQVS